MGPQEERHAEPLKEWFVVFIDEGEHIWWHRFLKKGFRHCLAFGFDNAAQRWLIMDPLFDGVYLRAHTGEQIDRFIGALIARDAVIIHAKTQGHVIGKPRLLLTCVTAIAHLLAVKESALTPYGLYRLLVRNGANHVFEARNDRSVAGSRTDELCGPAEGQ